MTTSDLLGPVLLLMTSYKEYMCKLISQDNLAQNPSAPNLVPNLVNFVHDEI